MPTDLDLVQAAQLALAFKHRAEGNKDDADKIIIEKLYEHPELSLFRRAKVNEYLLQFSKDVSERLFFARDGLELLNLYMDSGADDGQDIEDLEEVFLVAIQALLAQWQKDKDAAEVDNSIPNAQTSTKNAGQASIKAAGGTDKTAETSSGSDSDDSDDDSEEGYDDNGTIVDISTAVPAREIYHRVYERCDRWYATMPKYVAMFDGLKAYDERAKL